MISKMIPKIDNFFEVGFFEFLSTLTVGIFNSNQNPSDGSQVRSEMKKCKFTKSIQTRICDCRRFQLLIGVSQVDQKLSKLSKLLHCRHKWRFLKSTLVPCENLCSKTCQNDHFWKIQKYFRPPFLTQTSTSNEIGCKITAQNFSQSVV